MSKEKIPTHLKTYDFPSLDHETSNLYESIMIIGKRSKQIATHTKKELDVKLQDFSVNTDSLEEVFENREQIEISRHYERMPKPTQVAIHEFKEGDLYYRSIDESPDAPPVME